MTGLIFAFNNGKLSNNEKINNKSVFNCDVIPALNLCGREKSAGPV
jgi:hypothetical protein